MGPPKKEVLPSQVCHSFTRQEIKWINNDIRNHRLVSGNPDTLISDGVFDTGEISVGKTGSTKFNNYEKSFFERSFCRFLYNF